jgi:hypothetical protein
MCLLLLSLSVVITAAAPAHLIIDTDLGFDVDDVGAIAVAHALADQGKADILAIVCNTGNDACIIGVDIVNTYYGRKVPIGSYKGKFGSYTDNGQAGHYVNDVKGKFPHTVNGRNDVPSALDVYKNALQNAEDKSVTIASIGETTNLQDLLRNDADLVKQKVKRIVYMDGGFNFGCADGAYGPNDECWKSAQYVVANMPSPDVEQIFQLHGDNHNGWWVGSDPKCTMDNKNPVMVAYSDMCRNTGWCDNYGRDSWDLNTVYVAVMGAPGGGQCAIGSGRPCAYSVSDDGKSENRNYNDHSKNMYDFSLIGDISSVGNTIEELLCQAPGHGPSPPPPSPSPGPSPSIGCKVSTSAKAGAGPAMSGYGGGDYQMAWDDNTDTFYDYSQANGGWTQASMGSQASLTGIKWYPRANFLSRHVGGRFVGVTADNDEVTLATISDASDGWNTLRVNQNDKFTSVKYYSPDGGYGNIAEIKVYVPCSTFANIVV